jgi:cephalosporin-C deacetylase
MPLEQLEKYQGRNPRPGDFDAFWEEGLAEMNAIDPQIELAPAQFQVPHAECFDMFFTGVGSARVHAKLLRPHGTKPPHPAILMFHSYAESSGDWADKLCYVAMGYMVAALDCRGQGGLSEDPGGAAGNTLRGHIIRGLDDKPQNLLYRQIFLDAAQLAKIVMARNEVDENRVGATGMSQGGALTLACAALEPRIQFAAPVSPFLCDYKRVWEIDLARDGYAELREYFRRFDPLHEREEEIFLKLGYIDVQHLCPRIRAETLMTVGLMDTVCPPSTQFAAYNKIPAKKSMLVYPDFGHEIPPGQPDKIFRFMLQL